MKVLVTGANGQLGRAIVEAFAGRATVVPMPRAVLDISNRDAVAAAVDGAHPDAIINCAAYNDVDGAEDAVAAALEGNAFGVLALAQAARGVGATFVHYGTDFVFDGAATEPYTEEDPPNPQSAYGASKLLGEWFAADAPSYYVLRVESLFGGPQRRSSIDRIVAAVKEGSPARVFVDRTVTPSYVYDVAEATWTLLTRKASYGLYHCVNTGVTTWYEVGQRVKEMLHGTGDVVAVRTADVRMRARRPQYCALANGKLRAAGIVMPPWEDALERHLKKLETMS
jgi:dTDP-4-dehydrorhamnose reductase